MNLEELEMIESELYTPKEIYNTKHKNEKSLLCKGCSISKKKTQDNQKKVLGRIGDITFKEGQVYEGGDFETPKFF